MMGIPKINTIFLLFVAVVPALTVSGLLASSTQDLTKEVDEFIQKISQHFTLDYLPTPGTTAGTTPAAATTTGTTATPSGTTTPPTTPGATTTPSASGAPTGPATLKKLKEEIEKAQREMQIIIRALETDRSYLEQKLDAPLKKQLAEKGIFYFGELEKLKEFSGMNRVGSTSTTDAGTQTAFGTTSTGTQTMHAHSHTPAMGGMQDAQGGMPPQMGGTKRSRADVSDGDDGHRPRKRSRTTRKHSRVTKKSGGRTGGTRRRSSRRHSHRGARVVFGGGKRPH